jgi:hypothetical protein
MTVPPRRISTASGKRSTTYEFKPLGVYVTVVPPSLTNTAVLAKLGFDPRTMPMKPMSVEQCVSEGLNALREFGYRTYRRGSGDNDRLSDTPLREPP